MLSFGSYSNAGRRSKAVLEVSSFLRGISARTQSRRQPITTGRIIFLGQEVVLRLEYCFVSIRRPTSPSWWATSVKERRNSERRTRENVERERNVSDRAQVMKLVLVIQRLTSHHQVVLVLYILQVVIVTRKLQTVMKVILSASYVVVENHQSKIQLCSGSIVTRVASGPTPTVPWDATQLHVTLFVYPVLRNEKLVPLL